MRAYFEKLFKNHSQPQKQLPFIFPLLIALISGAIFSLALAPYYFGGWRFYHQHCFMQCYVNVIPRQPFAGLGLWFWFMVCRRVLALHLHPYLWRYPMPFNILMIVFMVAAMGLFTAFQTWLIDGFSRNTTHLCTTLGALFEWAKPGYSQVFRGCFAGYAFTERLLDGYAPLFGIYAVSFVVIVLACALVEILNRRWFWAIPPAATDSGAWGAGFIQFVQPKLC